ncbi:fused DSP-PTPase phosphatase/NAD kinase-like protein [Clostridium sp.]|uniref:fused DSP-PTPase phosphatase/NAD kinase-like protein n=1 Tax=Clostridium sp. TaxID=1506 RepID=UPI002580D9F1|nr:protein tyrosine phosphatase [Clostridium sp.]MBS4839476.1 protein tyrosine phosphatase [Clostridium sp.]MDU1401522.1 protein tyrosine phosphatase [Clostridium sp.]MDU4925527.1 protein tyrosine phosphatase [Clostridium sp.]
MIKRKNFNVLLSAFLVSVSLFSLIPYKIDAFIKEPSNTSQNNSETSYLVEDNENYDTMPFKFRKSNELQSIANNSTLNLVGLDNLNISGSQQFSKMNLPLLLKAIDTNLPVIDFDLRQESHGFINGIPISFENEHNNANKGLSNDQVLKKEKAQLDSIKKGVPISFHNHPNKTITPEEVFDEKTLVTSDNIKYMRIFATDEELPSVESIDSFITIIKNLKEDSWLHFHCKEGIGRTTTFMIFYDMMKNYNNVSANDITNRQIELADFDSNDVHLLTSERRIALYDSFYNYCKKYSPEFKTTFGEYIKSL